MKPQHVKWFYLVIFALTVIATWILRDYSASALQKVHFLSYCKYELTPWAVYIQGCQSPDHSPFSGWLAHSIACTAAVMLSAWQQQLL